MVNNIMKITTSEFDINNSEIIWGKFTEFLRTIIPYEEHWAKLNECQKSAIIVYIYDSEVLREGHIGFLDLHSNYISVDDVINAMRVIGISDKYIDNIKEIPLKKLSIDEMVDEANDEDDFADKMDELDEMFAPFDKTYCQLAKEDNQIQDKIAKYIYNNFSKFFEKM